MIKVFRGIMTTLPVIVYFRSLILSVTKGMKARSLTIAVEMLVSRGLDNGRGLLLMMGRMEVNVMGNNLLKVVTLMFLKVCIRLFGNCA